MACIEGEITSLDLAERVLVKFLLRRSGSERACKHCRSLACYLWMRSLLRGRLRWRESRPSGIWRTNPLWLGVSRPKGIELASAYR